ncbi:MAG: hypothetical protein AB1411_11585 [Nitrospirota bacterium]
MTDGLWFRFQRQPWVLYLLAIKPGRQNRAIFLDPVLLPGREEVRHWRRVFRTMPPALTRRIRAVVCDNLRGMKRLVRRQGWGLRLCHLHLISQLQARRGRRKPALPGTTTRELAYRLVWQALELPDGPRLVHVLQRLRRWQSRPCPSRRLRMVVREFLRERDSFRAYRLYPDLELPATTNAVEAMGRLIRDLARQARNFRSPQALQQWAVAFVRRRPAITCNGKHRQPN